MGFSLQRASLSIIVSLNQQQLMQSPILALSQKEQQHQNHFAFLEQNRYQVQENAVFIDYQPQALLSKIDSYKSLSIYQRTALAKNISSVRDALHLTPHHFHHFLSLLAQDCESNQEELLEFLSKEVERGRPGESRKGLMTALLAMIESAHLEMKEQACCLLVSLVHSFSVEERHAVNQFAEGLLARQEEDLRIAGVQLTAKMATFLTHKEAEAYFTTTFKPLYESTTLRVKKELIASCAQLGKHVSEHFFSNQIIKHFIVQRCKDSAMGIRKSIVEVLPLLVELTKTEKATLSSMLITFTKDGHKVVRLTACKVVPEFLAKHLGPHLPEALLAFYIDLPDHEINKIVNRENQILYPVAFYFTAVLQQAGGGEWPRMSRLFNKLLFYKNYEVTLPLASSFHQIAKVIGPELSHQYLFPAFNNIFKQHSDELKLVALGHFSQFTSIFGSAMRENLIDVFMVLQKNPKKWRIRYEVARQLSTIAQNYEAETLFRYILPISLKLANDPVSCIREETARHMHEVISGMSKDPAYENIAQETLKGFGVSQQYMQRETFARMVATLHLLHDFKEKYYGIVLQLASDPIIIVRMALAISVKEVLDAYPAKREVFMPVIALLRKDEQVGEILD